MDTNRAVNSVVQAEFAKEVPGLSHVVWTHQSIKTISWQKRVSLEQIQYTMSSLTNEAECLWRGTGCLFLICTRLTHELSGGYRYRGSIQGSCEHGPIIPSSPSLIPAGTPEQSRRPSRSRRSLPPPSRSGGGGKRWSWVGVPGRGLQEESTSDLPCSGAPDSRPFPWAHGGLI